MSCLVLLNTIKLLLLLVVSLIPSLIAGCRHDSPASASSVKSLISSSALPWDACVLELDADRWRSIRRQGLKNEFTAAVEGVEEHDVTEGRPRIILADLPVKMLGSRRYLRQCWRERRGGVEAIKR